MSDKNSTDNDDLLVTIGNHFLNFGHLYSLLIIFVFTIYTRLEGFQSLKKENGWLFLGNDSWYHFRATMYSVINYPSQIGFDPKTGYPNGASNGTFGTMFDFVHATAALIVGLGDPSVETVRLILIVSSPILSGLVVLVTYKLAKYVTGSRLAAVFSALILALIPGTFYQRGIAGFAQHHIAETLLLLCSLYFTMKALDYAQDNYVIVDVFKNNELRSIKGWFGYIGLATLFTTFYFLTWPPAVMYFGLVGITGLLYAVIAYNDNTTIEPTLITVTTLTGLMTLVIGLQTPSGFSIGSTSLLHLAISVVSFGTNLFLLVFNRYCQTNNWSYRRFLGSVSGLGIISVISVGILQPRVFEGIFSQIIRLLGNPFGLGSENTQTIAEERTTSIIELIITQYGLMMVVAFAGAFWIISRMYQRRQNREGYSSRLLLTVVFWFMLIISVRTIRFNYYLAPFIAIFASIALVLIIEFIGVPKVPTDIGAYHVLGLTLIIFLFIPVLVVPIQSAPVYQDVNYDGQLQGYEQWEGPLEWMNENTPNDGVGMYEPADSSYDYNDETYGVMSWWDYGHWITVTGERTPVANPFQQNAQEASQFLLAQNPEEAEQVMNELGENANEENASAKYVAIDWQMASPLSKFSAIAEFNEDIDLDDTATYYYQTRPGERAQVSFAQRKQAYYESMIGRLFVGHGSAMEASSKTIEYNTRSGIRTIQPQTEPIVDHGTPEAAEEYASNRTEISRGGFGEPRERVEALEQYRLVKSAQGRLYGTGVYGSELRQMLQSSGQGLGDSSESASNLINDNPSTVKIFERVEGANINGSGYEPNEQYTVSVEVLDPVLQKATQANREAYNVTFEYTQRVTTDSDGTFTATVPYSTTGYSDVEYPPEVRGSEQYSVINSNGTVVSEFDVPEEAVIEDNNPITVESSE